MPSRPESDHGPMWVPALPGEAGAMSHHDPAPIPAGAPERRMSPTLPSSTTTAVPDPTGDLVARGLVMTYGRSGASAGPPALGGVDVTVRAGESVAVMGPSGSGKTTLLHVLAGILRPTGGQVLWRGRDVARMSDRDRTVLRRKDFGFVFQQGMLLPELPAIENVALPLMLGGVSRSEATARAATLFAPLGLSGLE